MVKEDWRREIRAWGKKCEECEWEVNRKKVIEQRRRAKGNCGEIKWTTRGRGIMERIKNVKE